MATSIQALEASDRIQDGLMMQRVVASVLSEGGEKLLEAAMKDLARVGTVPIDKR